jgi:pimeloyl-ACP methyl ester carboxylesterase
MKNIPSKTILFITGAFVSHSGWDTWKTYFESKGYKTIAPPWPHKEGAPKDLRAQHPDSPIASVRLQHLVDHYMNIAKSLPEKPIAIGHSLGGLLTQLLLQRDVLAAGVAVHSVPPQGVMPTQFSFFKSTWRALGLFTSTKKTYLMSFKTWQYAFTNGMPLEAQQKAYEENCIPESKLALRDGLSSVAKVDFKKTIQPLLFLAGDKDHCVPAALNLTTWKRYQKNNSGTEYHVMPGRNHFVLGQPTWQQDAEFIYNWLK